MTCNYTFIQSSPDDAYSVLACDLIHVEEMLQQGGKIYNTCKHRGMFTMAFLENAPNLKFIPTHPT